MKLLLSFVLFLGLIGCGTEVETQDLRTDRTDNEIDISFQPDEAFGLADQCNSSKECNGGKVCMNDRTGIIEEPDNKLSGPERCVTKQEQKNKWFKKAGSFKDSAVAMGRADCDSSQECASGRVCWNKKEKAVETYKNPLKGGERCVKR